MKKGIHKELKDTRFICTCGEEFIAKSTKDEIHLDICSKCHPFYTGSQKNTVVGGRSERFKKKFNIVDED